VFVGSADVDVDVGVAVPFIVPVLLSVVLPMSKVTDSAVELLVPLFFPELVEAISAVTVDPEEVVIALISVGFVVETVIVVVTDS
jgi:hypothetical protein